MVEVDGVGEFGSHEGGSRHAGADTVVCNDSPATRADEPAGDASRMCETTVCCWTSPVE